MASCSEVMMDIKYNLSCMSREDMGERRTDLGRHKGKMIQEILKEPDHREYSYLLECYLSKI